MGFLWVFHRFQVHRATWPAPSPPASWPWPLGVRCSWGPPWPSPAARSRPRSPRGRSPWQTWRNSTRGPRNSVAGRNTVFEIWLKKMMSCVDVFSQTYMLFVDVSNYLLSQVTCSFWSGNFMIVDHFSEDLIQIWSVRFVPLFLRQNVFQRPTYDSKVRGQKWIIGGISVDVASI